ncbi:hypothetical protein A3D88_02050 [Candidatus Peribacteria bacterium RIFCSPHIGHO2_02_FULL_52_16]|nr:MAG: hypothetical protein A2706_00170 [Candidatus Peribacteria bacterium RIFCSPHIGHO2_01_FULL_51_35]OGJ61407.1 MAG: hypothetical protein A3D88_02050 [Candidatus Peribacteria bacterium RIFCSPHIGHO2_02_FULL_52_16]
MSNIETSGHKFDLEERTFKFSSRVRDFIAKIPRTITNIEYLKQLARSSGSVGANYIEGNDALGDRDFLVKIKTSRREAKESSYWLKLLTVPDDKELQLERQNLAQEATEFVRIFSAMIRNFKTKQEKKDKVPI